MRTRADKSESLLFARVKGHIFNAWIIFVQGKQFSFSLYDLTS